MEIKGTLKKICDTEEIQGRNGTFQKRTIVIDCSSVDDITGEIRENILAFETSGRFCADYNEYVGDLGKKVTVRFGISGRCYVGGDGKEKYMNTLRIIGMTVDDASRVAPSAAAMPAPKSSGPAPEPKADFNQPQDDQLPF